MKNSYIAIIPARAGSVRLKNKHLLNLGGKPLISHTIDAAKESGVFANIIVSTDDVDIASIARDSGIEIESLRPAELATSQSDIIDVLIYELGKLKDSSRDSDMVVLLQPTSPFRSAKNIVEAIEKLEELEADSLTSVSRSKEIPYWAWQGDVKYIKPVIDFEHVQMGRHDLPNFYFENGAIFICERKILEKSRSLYGSRIAPYLMELPSSIDIDTLSDLEYARYIFRDDKNIL